MVGFGTSSSDKNLLFDWRSGTSGSGSGGGLGLDLRSDPAIMAAAFYGPDPFKAQFVPPELSERPTNLYFSEPLTLASAPRLLCMCGIIYSNSYQ